MIAKLKQRKSEKERWYLDIKSRQKAQEDRIGSKKEWPPKIFISVFFFFQILEWLNTHYIQGNQKIKCESHKLENSDEAQEQLKNEAKSVENDKESSIAKVKISQS